MTGLSNRPKTEGILKPRLVENTKEAIKNYSAIQNPNQIDMDLLGGNAKNSAMQRTFDMRSKD